MSRITLSNMQLFTKQAIFDQCVNHLLTQMRPSQDPKSGKCLYKGHNNLQCAVGCFISEDEYSDTFEGKNSYCLLRTSFSNLHQYHEVQALLASLQNIHDNYSTYDWNEKLRRLADRRKLKFNWGRP